MSAVRLGIVLSVLSWAWCPLGAAAQDEDPAARARQLFSEGVELAGQHQYADAATHFRQALALRDAPAIRYNLASTLFEEHQVTEANEIVNGLLAITDLPDSVRTPTLALQQQIRASSGFVTFTLPSGVTGEVQLDDTPVADPRVASAVTPGSHHVVAIADGATVAEARFELGSGVNREIALEPASAQPSGGAEGPLTDQWWFWAAIGGGVVVLGVIIGVAAGVADHDAHAPISGNCSPGIISW